MKINHSQCKTVAILMPLFANAALAFEVSRFFSSTNVYSGTTLSLQFRDAPSLVNVKFAVQNPDNTLTSIESSTNFNVAPSSFSTNVRVSEGIKPGINYFVVAVDVKNPENYATNGPFSIYEPLGDLPSASITVNSGTAYATGGGSAALPSATGQTSASKPTDTPTPTPTASSTSKGSATGTSEPASKTSSDRGGDDGSFIKLTLGAIVGIAVGGALGGAIIGLLAYYILFRKCRQQPVLPVASRPTHKPKPSDNPGKNSGIAPLTVPSSETISINTNSKPQVTAVPVDTKPQNSEINTSVQVSSPQSADATLISPTNTSSETTFKYQYPPNFSTQPEYPPFSYPHNSAQYEMSYYPPMNDSMPTPEHHFGPNGAYPPMSPTYYNYPSFHQQPYPPYPPNQASRLDTGYNPFHASSKEAANADAGVSSSGDDAVLAQKVEYDGITADNKAEYHQKPDTAVDEKPVYTKPNQRNST